MAQRAMLRAIAEAGDDPDKLRKVFSDYGVTGHDLRNISGMGNHAIRSAFPHQTASIGDKLRKIASDVLDGGEENVKKNRSGEGKFLR